MPSLKPNTLSGCVISRCLPSLFSKFRSAFSFHIRLEENGTKIYPQSNAKWLKSCVTVKTSLFDQSTLQQLDKGKEKDRKVGEFWKTFFVITVAFHLRLPVKNNPWNLCDSGPRHHSLKRNMLLCQTANKVVEKSKRCIFIYIFFQLFLLFSFISATGVMETDVYQEKCFPSEATTGKSDSVMSEFCCHATC